MSEKNIAKFEFTVEGLSRERAEMLLETIKLYVETVGLEMAGGVTWEVEDGEEESTSVS